MPRSRKLALDRDTALEDTQWEKLTAFLTPLISAEDLQTVEDICRGGGDAPEKSASGAADARSNEAWAKARALDAAAARTKADAVPGVVYDTKTFPHSGRLR